MIEELGITLSFLGLIILKRAGANYGLMLMFIALSLLIQLFLMLEFKNETLDNKTKEKGYI